MPARMHERRSKLLRVKCFLPYLKFSGRSLVDIERNSERRELSLALVPKFANTML